MEIMHKRQSGIELLRLFVMFGIVLSHWGGHGSWVFLISENPNIYPRFWKAYSTICSIMILPT